MIFRAPAFLCRDDRLQSGSGFAITQAQRRDTDWHRRSNICEDYIVCGWQRLREEQVAPMRQCRLGHTVNKGVDETLDHDTSLKGS